VHGANRLASNSLLEGLVFGALAAEEMKGEVRGSGFEVRGKTNARGGGDEDVEGWITELRALMWRDAGLLRDGVGLLRAQAELSALWKRMPAGLNRRALDARNLHAVAEAMVLSALGREESRGAHFRRDFPEHAAVARHSVVEQGKLSFAE
jgi:L-aspartate oxidase